MQKSRRQHVVPKFILKNFSNNKNNIFVYNKKTKRIYEESIEKSFVEKDVYSYKKNGIIHDALEKKFSKTESNFSNIYKLIKDKNLLKLKNKSKIIDEFFYISILRSPRVNRYAKNTSVYLRIENILRTIFPPDYFLKFLSADNIDDIKYRILIYSLLEKDLKSTKNFIKYLNTYFFETNRSFVVSNSAFIVSRKFSSIIIPISKNIILSKGSYCNFCDYRFIELDMQKTREINLEIFNDDFSDRVGSHSKELLNSLKNPR